MNGWSGCGMRGSDVGEVIVVGLVGRGRNRHPVSIQFSEGIYSYGKNHIIKTPYFGAKI